MNDIKNFDAKKKYVELNVGIQSVLQVHETDRTETELEPETKTETKIETETDYE